MKTLIVQSFSGLLLWLCGCAATQQTSPTQTGALDPGMARIYIHRQGSIIGAVVPDYWVDFGTNARRNATMLQFSRLAKAPYLISTNRESLESILKIQRGTTRGEGVLIHYFSHAPVYGGNRVEYVMMLDTGKEIRIPLVGSLSIATKDGWRTFSAPPLPFNVSVIGKVGPGGTLVWDRPPGMVELEILSDGILVHPGGANFTVEAEKTYHLRYSPSQVKCTVTQEP